MVEPLAASWENSEFHRVAGLDSETSAMASRRRTWMETPTQEADVDGDADPC
jgi:hypothetical protein